MPHMIRIGQCENCQRTMKLRTLQLCHSCWKHRDQTGYQPWARENRPHGGVDNTVAEKMPDDWWLFASFYGRYYGIRKLADAYGRSISAVESWVRANDPGPIEDPVAA